MVNHCGCLLFASGFRFCLHTGVEPGPSLAPHRIHHSVAQAVQPFRHASITILFPTWLQLSYPSLSASISDPSRRHSESWPSDFSPRSGAMLHGPYKKSNLRNISQSCDKKTTINMLPEDVLLEIFFHFCETCDVNTRNPFDHFYFHGAWYTLVHVCQRWRQTIFASPSRLDLRLLCTNRTPARKNLDLFPALPIVVRYDISEDITSGREDNLSAALERPDRVLVMNIYGTNLQLENMATVMQESFPVLTVLWLTSVVDRKCWDQPALPDGFLGGSTPRLQEIFLDRVPFPALPTLLSSTKDLVILRLERIPATGYVSPEAMVVCLASLTRLNTLHIEFQSPFSHPAGGRIRLPPETRAVLPVLTSFKFQGICEYLEELVSRIDSPQLNRTKICIMYSQLDDFQVTQLVEFISRSDGLPPILFRQVGITSAGNIYFSANDNFWSPHSIAISRESLGWDISEIAHLLGQFSSTLSSVAHLKFYENGRPRRPAIRHDHSGWEYVVMDDTEWLPFLCLFTAVRTLYVPEELSDQIALALEDGAGQMVTDVLPALSLLYLENQPESSVETFIAVRRDSGRPVTVVNQKTEFDTRLQSYLIE